MPVIIFKKQMFGKWRRNDGKVTKHVDEESMYQEMEKLINDGWTCTPLGITFIRAYELAKKD